MLRSWPALSRGDGEPMSADGDPPARGQALDRPIEFTLAEAHELALEKFLFRLLLRSELSGEECQAIRDLPGDVVTTAPHRDIVRPGQHTDFACMMVDGVAGRFDQLSNGHRQITALHLQGDICDLQSVPVPHTGWGIESLTETRVKKIPHEPLRALADRYPRIAFAFWRDTIVDASILAKWISALGRRGARSRLAHLVCELGVRFEQARLGTRSRFDLSITQSQLADVLGVTPVHLNRTLQKLRQEDALYKDGATITVPNLERLERIALFDPTYLLLSREAD